MPPQIFYPPSGCAGLAELSRTRLANAKMRLWKSGLVLTWDTTLAQLNAAEADYDGYTPGGITIPAWGPALQGPGQTFVISGGVQSFVVGTGGPGNWNVIGGWYLVTADNVLWAVGEFPAPVPMQQPGAGQPVALSLAFPSG